MTRASALLAHLWDEERIQSSSPMSVSGVGTGNTMEPIGLEWAPSAVTLEGASLWIPRSRDDGTVPERRDWNPRLCAGDPS
jgi:hypothetical protein